MFWRLIAFIFVRQILKKIQSIKNQGSFCVKFSQDEIPFVLGGYFPMGIQIIIGKIFSSEYLDFQETPINHFSKRRVWVREMLRKRLPDAKILFNINMFGEIFLTIEI